MQVLENVSVIVMKCKFCDNDSIGCMFVPSMGNVCICNSESCKQKGLDLWIGENGPKRINDT